MNSTSRKKRNISESLEDENVSMKEHSGSVYTTVIFLLSFVLGMAVYQLLH